MREPPSELHCCGRSLATSLVVGVTLLLLITATIAGLLWDTSSKAYRPSVLGRFSSAAVAVDGEPCAKIARDILEEGGTAVDAALGAVFCNGAYSPQSLGLGGGFLLTHYHAQSHKVETLDAREAAPGAAQEEMFIGKAEEAKYGPLSVAVPGSVAGYWEAKEKYGNRSISWHRLIAPTVNMCREGITVSWTQASVLRRVHDRGEWAKHANIHMNTTFHDPDTGEPWLEGQVYTRQDYASTLETLAKAGDNGEHYLGFYTGQVGRNIVSELEKEGGILTLKDMEEYRARWLESVQVKLDSLNSTLYSVPPPGSGAILAYITNMLDLYRMEPGQESPLLWHRVVETFKWAYALRTEMGDGTNQEDIHTTVSGLVTNLTSEAWARDRFLKINDTSTINNAAHYGAVFYTPEDHGTAHVSVISSNGDAVSLTSTINLYFGSLLMSPSTGIILNDEMDDFSTPGITNYFGVPPSPNNFIRPGKRPLSSMCPSIVVDDLTGKVRLVIGGAGGTKITTAIALTMVRNMWLGQDLKTAIDARRIHHQLAPMKVFYEPGVDRKTLMGLEQRGHQTELVDKFGSVVVGIERSRDGELMANADFRKCGAVDGF